MCCFSRFQRLFTVDKERLSKFFCYWLTNVYVYFIIFTVRHHTVKNQNVISSGSWRELGNILDMQQPVCVNKLFFRRNDYWKHFGDKNETCQFMLYLTNCRKIYWVSMCITKTNIDSWVLLAPMLVWHQTSNWNSQHYKFLTFLVVAWKSSFVVCVY